MTNHAYPSMSTLRLERRNAVAILTLNRPDSSNAVDMVMREEFLLALRAIRNDPAVKALVITGAGRAFCAGGDVKAIGEEQLSAERGRERLSNHLMGWVGELVHFDRPVIAAINGVAYGGGFSLALMADFVIAARSARFCAFFQRIGLTPDGGMHWLLTRAIGTRKAKELMMTTREIGVDEALHLGLVNQIAPDAELLETAIAYADGFTHASSTALALCKEIVDAAWTADLQTVLRMEAAALGINVTTPYHRDAVQRFRRKEPHPFPPPGWSALKAPRS